MGPQGPDRVGAGGDPELEIRSLNPEPEIPGWVRFRGTGTEDNGIPWSRARNSKEQGMTMRSLDVLVPLDGSAWSDAAARFAISLGSRAPRISRLTGLHVVGVMRVTGRLLQDLAGLIGFEPVVVPEDVEAYYRERGERFLADFARRCEEAGLPCESLLDQGNVVDRIVHRGSYSDLVVLGARGVTEENHPGHGGRTVERVVRRVATTVMSVPKDFGEVSGVVLGCDGSEGSAKAMRSTRHLVELCPVPVHAVHVTGGEPPEGAGADPLEEVRARFEPLDVELHLHRQRGEPGEALLAAARQWNCNVVAVGYRGRIALRGEVLGRVTEYLFRHPQVGLLVSR